MPEPRGYSACISTRRRPSPDTAPTHAKAPCLYPQSGLALVEAKRRGYENAVMLDQLGNVAEFATANIMIAKGGAVHTPVPNGTFRSEERSVGKEWASPCRSRWSPSH